MSGQRGPREAAASARSSRAENGLGGIWASLGVTLIVQILAAVVLYVPPVLAPVAYVDVGHAASTVGLVTSLIFAAAMVAALRSGPSIARHGALRTSQVSCSSVRLDSP